MRPITLLPLFVLLPSLLGCPADQWYEHPCGTGDPLAISCLDEADTLWEEPSTDLCSDLEVSADEPCDEAGAQCVLTQAFTCTSMDPGMRTSESFLTCRNTPFEEGQCPSSSRSVKRDIHYIAPDERQRLAKEVLDVKLARYHYRDAAKPGRKLGYILEDHPQATFSGDGRVDLYAYVSAVVALAQEQQAQIDSLKSELEALKAQR
jgi:hypothetical protein